jgi:hypothetical protein
MRALVLILVGGILGACSSLHYARVKEGTLEGRLVVEWIRPDRFIFRPDPDNPLRFVRSNGKVIQPQTIHTDGGSIPRPMWAFKNYSPWGYAPAFIIHDWLFHVHRRKLESSEDYDLKEAALVLSEVMKTMMESDPTDDSVDPLALYLIYQAVRSPIARHLWNKPEAEPEMLLTWETQPVAAEWVVEWPSPTR